METASDMSAGGIQRWWHEESVAGHITKGGLAQFAQRLSSCVQESSFIDEVADRIRLVAFGFLVFQPLSHELQQAFPGGKQRPHCAADAGADERDQVAIAQRFDQRHRNRHGSRD